MFIKNNIIYAGITNEKGLALLENNVITKTGYQIKRITDGKILGVSYEMVNKERENMFIEVSDNEKQTHFEKDRTIIAGVYNEEGFDLCINTEDLYTMKKFIRIHDGFEMGNVIYLGNDHSYCPNGTPRYDISNYYVEVDDIIEEETN